MSNEFMEPKTTFGDTLRFTAYAWAKLIWMRDRGRVEVAGYGITSTEDPLLVVDFVLVKQKCTEVTFELDPEDGIEYAERMMDAGLMPWMTQNLLIHTHPSNCPRPSVTDEENFNKAFSHCNWAIMLIIAQGGEVYCRLKINVAPGVIKLLKVEVDYSVPFEGSKEHEWDKEYLEKVEEKKCLLNSFPMFSREEIDDLCDQDEIDCFLSDNGNVIYDNYISDVFDGTYEFNPITGDWYKEDDEGFKPIDMPKTPFAKQIVEWAKENSEEREDEMISCQDLLT